LPRSSGFGFDQNRVYDSLLARAACNPRLSGFSVDDSSFGEDILARVMPVVRAFDNGFYFHFLRLSGNDDVRESNRLRRDLMPAADYLESLPNFLVGFEKNPP